MSIEKLAVFSEDGEKNTSGLVLTDGFPRAQKPARQWFNWLFNSVCKKINELIDQSEAYKVGDIYITTINHADATAVGLHHGYGTWQRTGEGEYLSFAGTSDGVTLTGGVTSGSHRHTITTAQLPAHDHTNGEGVYNKLVAKINDADNAGDVINGDGTAGILPAASPTASYNDSYIQVADISSDQYAKMTIQSVGSGQAMPIRPRTTTRFAWVRVADPE